MFAVVLFTQSDDAGASSMAETALLAENIEFRKLPITPFKEAMRDLIGVDASPSLWFVNNLIFHRDFDRRICHLHQIVTEKPSILCANFVLGQGVRGVLWGLGVG